MQEASLAAMCPEDERIAWTIDPFGIAVVRICQARKRNALTLSMWRALDQVFTVASRDPAIRGVILTGDGGHFCAGADISEFTELRADSEQGLAYDEINDRAVIAIRDCARPVMAAISGYAVGGGLSVALACDFRVADRTARMGIPAGRLGLVYSIADCELLVERIGLTAAKEILFTGRLYDIDEALRLGAVDHVTDGDAIEAAAAMAKSMSASAPLSNAGNKTILNAVARSETKERADELEHLIARAFDSRDYAEGQRAFAERRQPVFSGL